MSNDFGVVIGLRRLSVGVILLALFAFTSATSASVSIVNDLTAAKSGYANTYNAGTERAQVISTTVGGDIDNITLVLNVVKAAGENQKMNVYVDTVANNGKPVSGLGTLIGTVTTTTSQTGIQQFNVNVTDNDYKLIAGDSYAIVVDIGASEMYTSGGNSYYDVGWEFANNGSASTGSGAFESNGSYNGSGVSWNQDTGEQRMMEVDVVPEVSMTGVVMGIGAMAIAAGHTLRRKLCAVKIA